MYPVIFFVLLFSGSMGTDSAAETYYKWKDEDGVTHITNDPKKIPPRYRQSSKETEMEKTFQERAVLTAKRLSKNRHAKNIGAAGALIIIIILIVKGVKHYKVRRERRRIKSDFDRYEARRRNRY
ncbi:MAG: DUF4124 domain-containing protein [Thermodesulfobacteriota bacterium]